MTQDTLMVATRTRPATATEQQAPIETAHLRAPKLPTALDALVSMPLSAAQSPLVRHWPKTRPS